MRFRKCQVSDNINVAAAVLPKAFDYLPYDLLLSKFHHYQLRSERICMQATYSPKLFHGLLPQG